MFEPKTASVRLPDWVLHMEGVRFVQTSLVTESVRGRAGILVSFLHWMLRTRWLETSLCK